MIQKKKFQLSFKDILKEEQKSSLEQIVQLTEKLKSQQTKEEKIKTEQEIKDLIIKPESTEKKVLRISEIVATEIENIALPGYNFQRIQNTKSSTEGDLSIIQTNKESIEKQEAIQNILLNHFKVEKSQLIVLTERIEQKHLNHKYFAYYSIVKEKGILIVLNDQYGQAARIKKVKSQEQAEIQLALLIAMLENSDKKTMDEVQGFEAFANTYTSKEDLEELYTRKINQYTINPCDEIDTTTSNIKIDLKKSAKEIWESIQGKTIKSNSNKDKTIHAIHNFLELPFTVIVKGRIGRTTIRDIINGMLELKGEEKITSYISKEKGLANRTKIESAQEELKQKVLTGRLGEEARGHYEAYLKEKKEQEIELSGSAEEIWERIELPAKITKMGEGKDKTIETIQDFLELTPTSILVGKIGITPVREIINAMLLGLKGYEKITSYTEKSKVEANKEKVESAKELLKQKVLAGNLGETAKEEYKTYLKIESAEEIWERIELPAKITKMGQTRDKTIETIQDFLKLPSTAILKGNMGKIPVREIINAILRLEGEEKITTHAGKNEKGLANKSRIENAKKLLEEKVSKGELGIEAQREMQTIVEAEKIQTEINKEIKEI